MDDLAHYIENWADLPVVNRTALSGLFAVETEGWIPMRLPPPPPGNTPAASFDDLPTIFTVLRKLGLELKQQEATCPFTLWSTSSARQANEDPRCLANSANFAFSLDNPVLDPLDPANALATGSARRCPRPSVWVRTRRTGLPSR